MNFEPTRQSVSVAQVHVSVELEHVGDHLLERIVGDWRENQRFSLLRRRVAPTLLTVPGVILDVVL